MNNEENVIVITTTVVACFAFFLIIIMLILSKITSNKQRTPSPHNTSNTLCIDKNNYDVTPIAIELCLERGLLVSKDAEHIKATLKRKYFNDTEITSAISLMETIEQLIHDESVVHEDGKSEPLPIEKFTNIISNSLTAAIHVFINTDISNHNYSKACLSIFNKNLSLKYSDKLASQNLIDSEYIADMISIFPAIFHFNSCEIFIKNGEQILLFCLYIYVFHFIVVEHYNRNMDYRFIQSLSENKIFFISFKKNQLVESYSIKDYALAASIFCTDGCTDRGATTKSIENISYFNSHVKYIEWLAQQKTNLDKLSWDSCTYLSDIKRLNDTLSKLGMSELAQDIDMSLKVIYCFQLLRSNFSKLLPSQAELENSIPKVIFDKYYNKQ